MDLEDWQPVAGSVEVVQGRDAAEDVASGVAGGGGVVSGQDSFLNLPGNFSANRRNYIRKFSNFSPEFSSQWSSQKYEYIFGSIGNRTTNFVVDRTSHKVGVRIPILVDISQVAKSPFDSKPIAWFDPLHQTLSVCVHIS